MTDTPTPRLDAFAAQARRWIAQHWDEYVVTGPEDDRAPAAAFTAAWYVVDAHPAWHAVDAHPTDGPVDACDVAIAAREVADLASGHGGDNPLCARLALYTYSLDSEWAENEGDVNERLDVARLVVAWYLVKRRDGLLDEALALKIAEDEASP